jgi:hypothetical protein
MALPKDARPIRAAFPSGPLTDQATGEVTPAWRGFFMAMYARTGDAAGVDSHATQAALVEADNNLAAVDAQLSAEIIAETNARRIADTTEATARAAGDAALDAAKVAKAGDTMTGPLAGPQGTFDVVQLGTGGPTWTKGSGVPASAAITGSLYSRTTGTAGSVLYVNVGGTTWTPIA